MTGELTTDTTQAAQQDRRCKFIPAKHRHGIEFRPTGLENVAGYILEALKIHDDETGLAKLGAEVATFASKFPVPGLGFQAI